LQEIVVVENPKTFNDLRQALDEWDDLRTVEKFYPGYHSKESEIYDLIDALEQQFKDYCNCCESKK